MTSERLCQPLAMKACSRLPRYRQRARRKKWEYSIAERRKSAIPQSSCLARIRKNAALTTAHVRAPRARVQHYQLNQQCSLWIATVCLNSSLHKRKCMVWMTACTVAIMSPLRSRNGP